jgi:DNA-binding NarL/FixJ family response regulator
LIVEDDTLVSMMIEAFLGKLGCEVVATAESLQDGLLKARTLVIDAAMLDINLAGDTSYLVAEALEARKIPFFFASAYDVTELPPRLVGVPVLSKPFGMQQLAIALRLAIESRPGP